MKRALIILSFLLVTANVQASPLNLDYSIQDDGGRYYYTFILSLTNSNGSWLSDDFWNWIIFGNTVMSSSPIQNFELDKSIFLVDRFSWRAQPMPITGQH